jgi:hypothetical protein
LREDKGERRGDEILASGVKIVEDAQWRFEEATWYRDKESREKLGSLVVVYCVLRVYI